MNWNITNIFQTISSNNSKFFILNGHYANGSIYYLKSFIWRIKGNNQIFMLTFPYSIKTGNQIKIKGSDFL